MPQQEDAFKRDKHTVARLINFIAKEPDGLVRTRVLSSRIQLQNRQMNDRHPFYVKLAEDFNNKACNSGGLIDPEDPRLYGLNPEMANLTGPPISPLTCSTLIENLVKMFATAQINFSVSGQHSPDFFAFCPSGKYHKVDVYYLHLVLTALGNGELMTFCREGYAVAGGIEANGTLKGATAASSPPPSTPAGSTATSSLPVLFNTPPPPPQGGAPTTVAASAGGVPASGASQIAVKIEETGGDNQRKRKRREDNSTAAMNELVGLMKKRQATLDGLVQSRLESTVTARTREDQANEACIAELYKTIKEYERDLTELRERNGGDLDETSTFVVTLKQLLRRAYTQLEDRAKIRVTVDLINDDEQDD